MMITQDIALVDGVSGGGYVAPAPMLPTMDPTLGIVVEQPVLLYPPTQPPYTPILPPPLPMPNAGPQTPCSTCQYGSKPPTFSPQNAAPAAVPVKTNGATTAATPQLTSPKTWPWWALLLAGAVGALVARKLAD